MKQALVIEDMKPVRESLGEILQYAGCETRLISDGQVALKELFENNYDLITLDLNMPSMDGVSMAEAVTTQEGPNAATPFVVVSAYLSDDVVEDLKGFGIEHFLEKPFSADELLNLAKNILEKPEA